MLEMLINSRQTAVRTAGLFLRMGLSDNLKAKQGNAAEYYIRAKPKSIPLRHEGGPRGSPRGSLDPKQQDF